MHSGAHTPNNMRRVRKLQHIYCIPKYTQSTFCSVLHPLCHPSSCRHKTLFPSYSLSFLLLSYAISSPLLLSPSVLLLLSLLSSSPACQLSSNVKQQSTPTLPSLLLLCRVEGERRRGITDNSEWGREDEREEEHKYRQQALITQMRFDSQHNPYSIHIQKTDP